MLWYWSKLEYVVRSCAKAWLERQGGGGETNYKSLCETFAEETAPYCEQLHGIFAKCFDHVGRTLDVLMHYSVEHRCWRDSKRGGCEGGK